MAKYDKYNPRSRAAERPWEIHPVWQGIGCLMMILIPIMAYAGAVLIVQENTEQGWIPFPVELMRTVTIRNIGSVDHLYATLLVAFVLAMLGFSFMVFLYSFLYRIVGPPRLGPLDAEEERGPRKRRR